MARASRSTKAARDLKRWEEKPTERRAPRGKIRWRLSWAARFVAKWEGWLPEAYLDTIASPPIWTIGYGHTGGVQPGERWSKAKGLAVLTKDLLFAAQAVSRNIKVKLAVRQRIALISLVFNCGPGAVDGSELQQKLNAGHYLGAANEFLEWSHARGMVVEGLLNRRREERWMFLHTQTRRKK
jgi:lysozyme